MPHCSLILSYLPVVGQAFSLTRISTEILNDPRCVLLHHILEQADVFRVNAVRFYLVHQLLVKLSFTIDNGFNRTFEGSLLCLAASHFGPGSDGLTQALVGKFMAHLIISIACLIITPTHKEKN